MTGCRWREDTGFEGQCDKCRQWWPLDKDYWYLNYGMRRCRACHREERTAYVRELRAANPEMRAEHRARSRANQAEKRRVSRDEYLEYQRRWWAANHARLMAEAAERHAIKMELEGRRPTRASCRIETDETRAFRAAYRVRWIANHGPLVSPVPALIQDRQRVYNRAWMREHRARKSA